MRIADPLIAEAAVLHEASPRRLLEAVLLRRHREIAEMMIE